MPKLQIDNRVFLQPAPCLAPCLVNFSLYKYGAIRRGMEAITVIADCRFYQMRILNAVSFNYSFYFSSVQITGSGSKQMEQDSSDTKRLFLLMSHLIHFNKD